MTVIDNPTMIEGTMGNSMLEYHVMENNHLDVLVHKTKAALDLWLSQPNSKTLQAEFKEANQALLEFSRSQRDLSH